MRACIGLLALSGCNFLTTDLEDGAPVRSVSGPDRSTRFGAAVMGLAPGVCGTAGGLIVGGQEPDGPRLYLVTFGQSGGSTRSTINDFNANFLATERIVGLRRGTPRAGVIAPLFVQTDGRTFEVDLDSDCNQAQDEVCDDFCTPIDRDTAPAPPDDLAGNVAMVDLLGAGGDCLMDDGGGDGGGTDGGSDGGGGGDSNCVMVTGSSGSLVVTGGAFSNSRTLEIPDGVDDNELGLGVAAMPFDGPGAPTEELAVGGGTTVLLYFRTGLANDCDPRDGAPADVACN